MNNEQLTKAVEELAKNQLEIIEAVDKVAKKVKKLKPKKESKGECSIAAKYIAAKGTHEPLPNLIDFFHNPSDHLDAFRYAIHQFTKESKQAGDKVVNEVETPKQDQKYYLCIKDYGDSDIKEGTVLSLAYVSNIRQNYNIYYYGEPIKRVLFGFIKNNPDYFIPIQQFETLKEGQEIEFTLRNGKTYKTKVEKNSCNFYQLSCYPEYSKEDCPFESLNQIEFKDQLNKKYGTSMWPNTPTLEDLTNDLNQLITLPDLSCKQPETSKDESYVIQANELIEHFMPLVNQWDETKPKYNECYQGAINEPLIGVWYYSKQNQRKAAIKCAIVHCELMIKEIEVHKILTELRPVYLILIKSELQKMLSE